MTRISWADKNDLVRQEYADADLEQLAKRCGCTVPQLRSQATRLGVFRSPEIVSLTRSACQQKRWAGHTRKRPKNKKSEEQEAALNASGIHEKRHIASGTLYLGPGILLHKSFFSR